MDSLDPPNMELFFAVVSRTAIVTVWAESPGEAIDRIELALAEADVWNVDPAELDIRRLPNGESALIDTEE